MVDSVDKDRYIVVESCQQIKAQDGEYNDILRKLLCGFSPNPNSAHSILDFNTKSSLRVLDT